MSDFAVQRRKTYTATIKTKTGIVIVDSPILDKILLTITRNGESLSVFLLDDEAERAGEALIEATKERRVT